MNISMESVISVAATITSLLLLVFAVDWRYFRDWVVVYLFKTTLNLLAGSVAVEKNLVSYPFRIAGPLFDTSLLFEMLVFPVLCILYNQVTRERGLWPILYRAVLFGAVIALVEYPLERYTDLIEYLNWSVLLSFVTLTGAFLASRAFIAFYRWGCQHFS